MKKLVVISSLALWWSACTQAPQAPKAETSEAQEVKAPAAGTSLTLLKDSSKVVAIGTKVTGRHEIAFPIKEGQLTFGEGGCIAGGKITLDLANLQDLDMQGEWKAKFEEHLRSEDFFHVAKYPEGVFEVTGCEKGNGDTVFIAGNLTLRGVTKNVRFPAVVHTQGQGIHAQASFNINRKDWGIVYKGKPDDLIRDEVNINLDIVAQ